MEKVTVLDFYADWCSPCKSMVPVLEKAETELKIEVKRINIEEDPDELSKKYKVQSLPTIIFMKGDEIIETKTGCFSFETLKGIVFGC